MFKKVRSNRTYSIFLKVPLKIQNFKRFCQNGLKIPNLFQDGCLEKLNLN